MVEIDAVEALRLLGLAVETRGEDYRYKDHYQWCAYVHDGKPACLIGVALDIAGFPLPDGGGIGYVTGWDDSCEWADRGVEPAKLAMIDASPGVNRLVDTTATEHAARIWQAAQNRQDHGGTWGEALADARAVARLLDVPVDVSVAVGTL